ncbi:hypothetical protein FHW58_003881 [Duganella sp. 1224]|uniref:DUF2812 domain-containing protein n=1 Tax=Duganella sp. 1224 TaxID=2587052 RepID=UPI0015C72B3F|nr:DUF2812 domain-containing protein [Duganella sp. 1224]NYE62662.1 hypothetical protein [Duganella sp. 1224]
MSKLVRKFKLWFVWQDEEHQQWLQQMAAQGLHLRGTNTCCIHTFERGEPADMVYRWDVRYLGPSQEYKQLFRDAGWELVTSTVGWHCWRKPRAAGANTEIFTQRADNAAKYLRVIRLLALVVSAEALAYWLIRWLAPGEHAFAEGMTWGAFTGTAVVGLYALARLSRRIKDVQGA